MKTPVLILGGDHWQRETLAAALAYEGFHAEHTGDVAMAMGLLESTLFCLLLIDPTEPSIGGQEAVERILACHPGLPTIVLSSNDEYLGAGSTGRGIERISKPVDYFALVDAIDRLLANPPNSFKCRHVNASSG